MEKELDFKKPIYINSFDADEIIFNMIREKYVKAVKYDGSLPVSLDTLKIKELCDKKEDFENAFYEEGKFNPKTYCDAVINVCFSSEPDFTDVDTIREDVKDVKDVKDWETKESNMKSWGLSKMYSGFLAEFKKNQESSSVTGKAEIKPDKLNKPSLWKNTVTVEDINISTNGTHIEIKTTLKNTSKKKITTPVLFYICQKDPKRAGKYKVLGTYESEIVDIEPGNSEKIESDLDIRSIKVEMKDKSGKNYYIVNKGIYRLFVGDKEHHYPVASLELMDTITDRDKFQNLSWSFDADRSFSGIEDDAKDPLPLDPRRQLSYRACAEIYSSILEIGGRELVKTIDNAAIGDKSGDPLRMRYLLYEKGFDFEAKDGTVRHYVVYKRSASKSKTGSCLFIWEDLYEEMKKWTWMDKYFDTSDPKKEYDLTSIKAYEALTLSNTEKLFKLEPKNILLINDAEGLAVKGNRRIACVEKDKDGHDHLLIKNLSDCKNCIINEKCKEKMTNYKNDIWDGQALLDESIFKELYGEEMHGMVLLRNHFFKACAFNTKISKYYNDEIKISTVYDMFGQPHNAEDIKLIITPDSLKYLKFADDLFGEEGENSRKAAYDHWSEHFGSFGVVKTDKPSNKNGRHNVGYQILNTLPLSKEDMIILFEHEKKYILDLWKDDSKFMKIIPKESAKGKFISRMYKVFDMKNEQKGFLMTDDYLSYKRQHISDIKRRMKFGSIELEGEMLTLCSMPYEMLEYSGLSPDKREKHKIKPLLGIDEAFIDGLANDETVTLCRYPHLSSGSVCSLKNKYCDEYKKWFNLKNADNSSAIVVISPYKSNIMVKLGGADFDSDTALFLKEDVIKKAAEQLTKTDGIMKNLKGKFSPKADGLPVAQASASMIGGDNTLSLSAYGQAKLDRDLSQTQQNVGSISNDIQLFNSYLWEELLSSNPRPGYCKTVYECILKLSVLNELEIDRSKHSIKVPLKDLHKEVINTEYKNKVILSYEGEERKRKYYQPEFLFEKRKYRGDLNIIRRGGKQKDNYWNCPPDHLSKLAADLTKPKVKEDETKPSESNKKKKIEFDYKDVYPNKKPNQYQYNEIKELMKTAVKKLDKLDKRRHKTIEDSEERRDIQTKLADDIAGKKNIKAKTIAAIVRDAMCKKRRATSF